MHLLSFTLPTMFYVKKEELYGSIGLEPMHITGIGLQNPLHFNLAISIYLLSLPGRVAQYLSFLVSVTKLENTTSSGNFTGLLNKSLTRQS